MTDDQIDPRYLGREAPPAFDDLDNLPLRGPVDVTFRSSELTAVCPVTDQPDFYDVTISLIGTTSTIETKSLKLYLRTWDGVGILAEDLASAVADRVWSALEGSATSATVSLVQARRGGIDTTAVARRS